MTTDEVQSDIPERIIEGLKGGLCKEDRRRGLDLTAQAAIDSGKPGLRNDGLSTALDLVNREFAGDGPRRLVSC